MSLISVTSAISRQCLDISNWTPPGTIFTHNASFCVKVNLQSLSGIFVICLHGERMYTISWHWDRKIPSYQPFHTHSIFLQRSVSVIFCHQSNLCATHNLRGRTGFLDKLEGNRAAGAKVVRTIKSLPPRQLPYKMPFIASHSRLMTCSQATIGSNQVCHQGNILLTVFLLRWKTFHRPGRVSLGLKT